MIPYLKVRVSEVHIYRERKSENERERSSSISSFAR